MGEVWGVIVVVAVASAAIKAAGPVVVGGRSLPPRLVATIAFLAPALLAALVVSETFSEGPRYVLDAKALGVLATAGALALRAPVLLAVTLAAVVAAVARVG